MTSTENKIRRYISQLMLFISDLKPILLSHHPNCQTYSKDVYHFGKYKLCIGCFTFYPTILITILLTLIFIELNLVNLLILFLISNFLFLPIILNILGLTRYRLLKIGSKISIGIGVGFFIVSILFNPLFNIIIKISLLFEINLFIGVIGYIRAKRMQKECLKCEYKGDWDNCPGMKQIRDKLYEHGFKKQRSGIITSQ